MAPVSSWITTKVAARVQWAPDLVTLQLATPIDFKPGQFVNVALTDETGKRERRSYSLASAPGAPAELYLGQVPSGQFSPRLLALQVGDTLELDSKPSGFFTLDELPLEEQPKQAWFLATGTGLGPFISMLRDGAAQRRFDRIIVVHGVRQLAHLGYREELQRLVQQSAGRVSYLPLVSREQPPPAGLSGRIPALISSGQLEQVSGVTLSPERSQVLLCGNPQMIAESKQTLEARGLRVHRRRNPGHILSENYW